MPLEKTSGNNNEIKLETTTSPLTAVKGEMTSIADKIMKEEAFIRELSKLPSNEQRQEDIAKTQKGIENLKQVLATLVQKETELQQAQDKKYAVGQSQQANWDDSRGLDGSYDRRTVRN